MPSTSWEVPADVFRTVCRLLATEGKSKSLASVARTCRNLQHIAETQLYDSVEMSEALTILNFFRSLGDYARIAALTRAISLSLTVEYPELDCSSAFFDIIRYGLSALTSPLRRFAIVVYVASRETTVTCPSFSSILRDCTVEITDLRIPTIFDQDLQKYLNEYGNGLRRLTLDPLPRTSRAIPPIFEPPVVLESTALPQLSTFEGPSELASVLVSQRPVTRCCIRMLVHKDRDGWWPSLATSRRVNTVLYAFQPNLHSLLLKNVDNYEDLTIDVLRVASSRLQNLRYLGRLNFPMSSKRPEFLEYLVHMQELKFLDLCVTQTTSTHPAHEAVMRHLALLCASFCPSLHTVGFTLPQSPNIRYKFVATSVEYDEAGGSWVVHTEDLSEDTAWLEI